MAATSATRDAATRADFERLVERTLGQTPEIVTGREEAELSFRGAVADLDPADGPFLVVDIGGGSTELVVGTADPSTPDLAGMTIEGAVSVDIGSVRITERLLPGDPPTAREITAARRLAVETLLPAVRDLPVERVRTVVMVAGTPTTIAAAAQRLTGYDPAKLHLSELDFDEMERAGTFLLGANRSHRAMLPYMHPGRVDVIGGGAIILQVLLRLIGERTAVRRVTVSEHDILDGLALSLG
jgi:exopolyphosphatase/guanosine-5'-triphosphate,3'-diphosphate pyrophosphatase